MLKMKRSKGPAALRYKAKATYSSDFSELEFDSKDYFETPSSFVFTESYINGDKDVTMKIKNNVTGLQETNWLFARVSEIPEYLGTPHCGFDPNVDLICCVNIKDNPHIPVSQFGHYDTSYCAFNKYLSRHLMKFDEDYRSSVISRRIDSHFKEWEDYTFYFINRRYKRIDELNGVYLMKAKTFDLDNFYQYV